MPVRKRNFKQNIHEIDVLITDTDQHSEYFNISELSEVLPGGKSFFKIAGSDLLRLDTEVLVEILDYNGNVIYTEYPDFVDESGKRTVVVYVYSETPPGEAVLTVVGEAAVMDDGSSIPSNWDGIYNVRWQQRITIEPRRINSFPILLNKVPTVVVEEVREAYREVLYLEGSTAELTGSIAGTYDQDNNRCVLVSSVPLFNENHIGGRIVVKTPQDVIPTTDDVEPYVATIIGVENSRRAYAYPPYLTSEIIVVAHPWIRS